MSYMNGIGNVQQSVGSVSPQGKMMVQTAKGSDGTNSASLSVQAASDQTVLSGSSGVLSLGLSGSDVRLSKVQALQQQIADGSYSVPTASVADKLIQSLVRP